MRGKLFTGARCFVLAAMSISAAGAWAEDCKRITDSAKRLACFDREANSKPIQPKARSEEAKIREAVRKSMKDPASALFGRVTVVTPDRACQTVNGRNSMGGYSGNQQALVVKLEGQWFPIGIHDISHARCMEIVQKFKAKE